MEQVTKEAIETPFGRFVLDERVPPDEIRLGSWSGPVLMRNISSDGVRLDGNGVDIANRIIAARTQKAGA